MTPRSIKKARGSMRGSTTASISSTRLYTSKDAAFEMALIDARYYPHSFEGSDDEEPLLGDLEDIRDRLQASRSSLSPSRFTAMDFRSF